MEVDPNTEIFTRYGVHLSGLSKEITSKQIVICNNKVLRKSKEKLIGMCWKKKNQVYSVHINNVDIQADPFTTVMKCTTDSHCNKENVSNQRGSIIS